MTDKIFYNVQWQEANYPVEIWTGVKGEDGEVINFKNFSMADKYAQDNFPMMVTSGQIRIINQDGQTITLR